MVSVMPSQPNLSAKVCGSPATWRVSTCIPVSPPKVPVTFARVSTGSTGKTVIGATTKPLTASAPPEEPLDHHAPRSEQHRVRWGEEVEPRIERREEHEEDDVDPAQS